MRRSKFDDDIAAGVPAGRLLLRLLVAGGQRFIADLGARLVWQARLRARTAVPIVVTMERLSGGMLGLRLRHMMMMVVAFECDRIGGLRRCLVGGWLDS